LQIQEITLFASDCARLRTPENDYARRDSKPQPTVLKTIASVSQVSGIPKTCDDAEKRRDRALTKPIDPAGAFDPDLACVLAAWPTLPHPIKAAVLALLDSARASLKGDSHNSRNSTAAGRAVE
jgi:hypothetical protein